MAEAIPTGEDQGAFDRFEQLAKRLLKVPKHEVDAERKKREPKPPPARPKRRAS